MPDAAGQGAAAMPDGSGSSKDDASDITAPPVHEDAHTPTSTRDRHVAANSAVPDGAQILTLMGSMLTNVQSVVGEGAAHALFRYGAFEEGKRMVQGHRNDLEAALTVLDRLFGHHATGHRDQGGTVEIHLTGSSALQHKRPALDLVLIGLLEGLLQSVYQVRYRGEVASRDGRAGVLRFTPDAQAP